MPELPDIEVYLHALRPRIVGRTLKDVRLASPFLVRSVAPPPQTAVGRTVVELRRLGKRIVWVFGDDLFFVFHLMIAGRFYWKPRGQKIAGRAGLAAFDFADGTLMLTEAGTRRRASLHVVTSEGALRSHDPGGLDALTASYDEFSARVRSENHTLKRTLTDPHLLDGIGNAYSDEILHKARLSPLQLTSRIGEDEMRRLFDATRSTLAAWRDRLIVETGDAFPEKVTAFREGWPCTDDTASRARFAAHPSSASATRRTKPTTVPRARPAAGCSPIAVCRDCFETTGRARSKRWRCESDRNSGRSTRAYSRR